MSLRNVATIPLETDYGLRRLFSSIILEACSMEQKTYEDDTDLVTLASGSSYAFSHSPMARYRAIVQVYEGTPPSLILTGISIVFTDSETTTITNSSGSDWNNVYINILLY